MATGTLEDFDADIGGSASGPLAKLYARSSKEKLIYPSDIANLGHLCVFRIRERTFDLETFTTTSAQSTIFSRDIILPMPPDLSTQYGVSYNSGATSGLIGAVFQKGTELADLNFSALGDLAVRAIAENNTAAAELTKSVAGQAANPYQAVFFQNPNLRTFSFNYKLFAKNEQESDNIRAIIRAFKSAMLPTFAQGRTLFNYPKVFEIEFRHDEYLFEIGTSVLTSFDVKYHAQGTPSYFEGTKAPTDVDISLSFQELNILTADQVDGIGEGNNK
tara:strand:+ start:93 stop:917 length:825 start_codon:yes stop_codon:yes gene_type:complete